MKKICFLFLASSSFALLPPLAQSSREIKALLTDAEFYDSLGSPEVVLDISRNDKGYLVVTQHYSMQVDVHYIVADQKFCGPAHFQFEFHRPIDLRTGEIKP